MLFFLLALNIRESTMALRKQHKMFVAAYNKPRCSTSWFKVAAGLGGPPIWGQLLSLRFLSSVACSTQTRAWMCLAGPCRTRQKLHRASPAAALPAHATPSANPSKCPSSRSPAWDLRCEGAAPSSNLIQPSSNRPHKTSRGGSCLTMVKAERQQHAHTEQGSGWSTSMLLNYYYYFFAQNEKLECRAKPFGEEDGSACWLSRQELPPAFPRVEACSLRTGSCGSRRRDVGLMPDTLPPLRLWQGGVAIVYAVGDKWVLLLLKERRCAVAALGKLIGQVPELLRVGQRLEHGVFPLQHRVPLVQLFDVLFQHLHLLADGIHQMTLHQVLKDKERGNSNWHIIKYITHSVSVYFKLKKGSSVTLTTVI